MAHRTPRTTEDEILTELDAIDVALTTCDPKSKAGIKLHARLRDAGYDMTQLPEASPALKTRFRAVADRMLERVFGMPREDT